MISVKRIYKLNINKNCCVCLCCAVRACIGLYTGHCYIISLEYFITQLHPVWCQMRVNEIEPQLHSYVCTNKCGETKRK